MILISNNATWRLDWAFDAHENSRTPLNFQAYVKWSVACEGRRGKDTAHQYLRLALGIRAWIKGRLRGFSLWDLLAVSPRSVVRGPWSVATPPQHLWSRVCSKLH